MKVWKTIHEKKKKMVREYYFSGYGKEKLQLCRPCRRCWFSIPQAWPVWLAASALTFRLPIAGAQVTSTMLSCTCYRKEKHLFSDMSLLHYTFKTFIFKRSTKIEDPCLKTGYKSIWRTKKSFLKPLKFRENISPKERRSETFSCRII